MKASSRTLLATAMSMGLGVFSGPEADPSPVYLGNPSSAGTIKINRRGGKGPRVAQAQREAMKKRHRMANRARLRLYGGSRT